MRRARIDSKTLKLGRGIGTLQRYRNATKTNLVRLVALCARVWNALGHTRLTLGRLERTKVRSISPRDVGSGGWNVGPMSLGSRVGRVLDPMPAEPYADCMPTGATATGAGALGRQLPTSSRPAPDPTPILSDRSKLQNPADPGLMQPPIPGRFCNAVPNSRGGFEFDQTTQKRNQRNVLDNT